jgi:mRNA-degrading endonuclease toxin of MazEF toxin-antitoxin module
MALRPGEVVLIRIDFHQTPDGKLCPVLSSWTRQTTILLPLPSRPRLRVSDFDIPIHQWREAGLNIASVIRVHKLTVLSKDEVVRRLGELATADRSALKRVLRRVFSLDR